jgi:hypothetical protein
MYSEWMSRMRGATWASALLAVILGASCSDRSDPPSESPSDAASSAGGADPGQTGQPIEDPLGYFIDMAGGSLASFQESDGSWAYYRSETADFLTTEVQPGLLGTLTTMVNLTRTGFEASPAFEQGTDYVRSLMTERLAWSLADPTPVSEDSWIEPDADATAVAMVLLSGRMPVEADKLEALRALFDGNRTAGGLYRTYFEGFYPEKGFVPEPNVPSLGVNLNVLGFFGKYGLERANLVAALRSAVQEDRYWEQSPHYRSLPILAYLASNAVEQGAPEAGEFLRKFLADYGSEVGTDSSVASSLGTVQLSAFVKARSHACLLAQSPCQDLDLWVFELAKRRQGDGSWPAAAFRETDVNEEALLAFVERRDFVTDREGRLRFDAERALESPGTVHFYGGSPAETTSFALKALTVYRDLLQRRANF